MNYFSDNVLGRKVQIRLHSYDYEIHQRKGIKLFLPTLNGIFVRRFLFGSWGYVIRLNEPLLLDRDGLSDEARLKYSTTYLLTYLPAINDYEGKDPFFLELTGTENKLVNQDNELHAILKYTPDEESVPSEMDASGAFFKNNPGICYGWIKLID